MTFFWIIFPGAVAILGTAFWLVVRRCDGSHEPRHRATPTRRETARADETFAESLATWNRPPEIASDVPVPEVSHEEWPPVTQTAPPIAGLPVRRPPAYDRGQQSGILLPPFGLAAAVAFVLTGLIAETGHREALERLACQDEIFLLRAEVTRLRDADAEARRDAADFPWLAGPEVTYTQWRWLDDAEILRELETATP